MGGVAAFERKLLTSSQDGINAGDKQEMINRVEEFGDNSKETKELDPFCAFIMEQLEDVMLRILILAAIVLIVLGSIPGLAEDASKDWIEGVALCFAIIIVVTVGSIVNYRKEKEFVELYKKSQELMKFTVKRNGKLEEINEEEIVIGDLVKIKTGTIIPCDGILVNGSEVKIDESSLTGESDLVEKDTLEKCLELRDKERNRYEGREMPKNPHLVPSPYISSGTTLAQGEGWLITLAVGINSKKGDIEAKVKENKESDDSKTPLQLKLEVIADQIGWFGVWSAVATMIALFIRLTITETTKEEKPEDLVEEEESNSLATRILRVFLLAIAIIVVAIPEGMPLAVTLSLAFSVRKMTKEQNLVRKMHACETMGNANYICTDKTGTLTQNLMKLFKLYDGNRVLNLQQYAEVKGSVDRSEIFKNNSYYETLKLATCLNLEFEIDESKEIVNASKTDVPFIEFFTKCGEEFYDIRQTFFPTDKADIRKFPFSSKRKKMTIVLPNDSFEKRYKVFMKGAAEIVLESCDKFMNPENSMIETLTEEKKDEITRTIKSFGEETLRNIVVTYKDIDENEYNQWKNQDQEGDFVIEQGGFVFVGLAGIKDSLREGVTDAVSVCHTAGIKVVMITGDNLDTAFAIASECGIVGPEDSKEEVAIEGINFYKKIGGIVCKICTLDTKECNCPRNAKQAKKQGIDPKKCRKEAIGDPEAFKKITENLRVIARSRPDDKYALVFGLRKLDQIVSVTGDGTNDAKALSRSDVGFAMGVMGTDIAKDSSDIIILDDNFASIRNAIKWGRNIYDNIRKFIVFQLTVNVCSVVLVFVTSAVGNETPIEAIQMLWLNLIMDSLGSLSLATEPPHDKIMLRHPYPKKESIINMIMWKHVLLQSLALFVLCFVLYLIGHKFIPENEAYREEQIAKIVACYGAYPGHSIEDYDPEAKLIFSGSENDWSDSVFLIQSMKDSPICEEYRTSASLLSAYRYYKLEYKNTSHMTIIFNVFVLWSLLNQINARVIDDTFNIFYRIEKNFYFLVILVAELGLQVILVQYGSFGFKTAWKGLDGIQWLICLGFAFLTFPCSVLFKLMKIEGAIAVFFKYFMIFFHGITCGTLKGDEEENEDEEPAGNEEEGIIQQRAQKPAEQQEIKHKQNSRGSNRRMSLLQSIKGNHGGIKSLSSKQFND